MKRNYKKRCLAFGQRKRQKGGFLSILLTLARPLLISVARSIGSKLLESLGKKNFGGRKRRYPRRRK